jgi:hypothetical protein
VTKNVLKVTRVNAVEQINKMEKIVDDLGRQVVAKSLPGERINTNTKVSSGDGVKMIMTRLAWSHTIGKDITGDGYPEIPLRFTFEDSESVIQFPLGFCPGDRSNASDPMRNFRLH